MRRGQGRGRGRQGRGRGRFAGHSDQQRTGGGEGNGGSAAMHHGGQPTTKIPRDEQEWRQVQDERLGLENVKRWGCDMDAVMKPGYTGIDTDAVGLIGTRNGLPVPGFECDLSVDDQYWFFSRVRDHLDYE